VFFLSCCCVLKLPYGVICVNVRSLLVMLDSLQNGDDNYLCADISQSWLLQCIERSDLIRVLEPVLLLLLHRDSARY
jgi:hypothetical protein